MTTSDNTQQSETARADDDSRVSRVATQNALIEVGRNLAMLEQRKTAEEQSLAALEEPLKKYAAKKDERPLVHMERLGKELLERNHSISQVAAEVTDIVQCSLAVTTEYKNRHAKAETQVQELENERQDQSESAKAYIEEIENLEKEVSTLQARSASQAKELMFLRKAFVASTFSIVWLACVLGAFQLHLAATLMSILVLGIAFTLHNDSPLAQFASTINGTMARVHRLLNGQKEKEEDHSLLPADKLTGAGAGAGAGAGSGCGRCGMQPGLTPGQLPQMPHDHLRLACHWHWRHWPVGQCDSRLSAAASSAASVGVMTLQ